MTIVVCVAGATGWTGRAIADAVIAADDLKLGSAVSRSAAGRDLGEAWGEAPNGVPVYDNVVDALGQGADVLVDYTSHEVVGDHVREAVAAGASVVIGSSGLGAEELAGIDAAAQATGVAVIAAGNFSITAAMAQAAALLVARHLPHCEIIDYAAATKPDAPSGTARELAERLGAVRPTEVAIPISATRGDIETRGSTIAGTPVHSVRLPSFSVSTEIVFALPDERLSIRHDAGSTAAPYVAGTLLAIRHASRHVGLVRGLDTLLLGSDEGGE